MSRKKQPALNKMNEARRKAEASALAEIMRERSRGNALGVHTDKRMKRQTTRQTKMVFALRDWN